MLSLITQNHVDLVMNLCKKAMRYHLNFHETTFRCVITVLVPNDLVLARQFYQYATQLGVYSPIKVMIDLIFFIYRVVTGITDTKKKTGLGKNYSTILSTFSIFIDGIV